MDRQTFLHYLQQPGALASLPRADLNVLVKAYPHSANLRLLLALKARRENDPEAGLLLERLAAATFDRQHLFDLLRQTDRPLVAPPEVLELRELEEMELVPVEHAFDELPSRLNELPGAPARTIPPADLPDSVDAQTKPAKLAGVREVPTSAWVDLAADFHSTAIATPAIEHPDRGPEDPERFVALIAIRDGERGLSDRLRSFRARASGSDDAALTRSDHPAVVSETLADLLSRQGQYVNAIRMYRRLVLLYPEKKPIFAGLIQELKQKL